jgi:uncharacterized membrane protein YcaP (DUF421 family)
MPLVQDGRLLRKNLRRQAISRDELWSELHAAGVSDLSQVKAAYVEGTGEISVIRTDGEQQKERQRQPV